MHAGERASVAKTNDFPNQWDGWSSAVPDQSDPRRVLKLQISPWIEGERQRLDEGLFSSQHLSQC